MRTIIISRISDPAAFGILCAGLIATPSLPAAVYDYHIAVDASLSRLEVTARFRAPVTDITARSADAAKFLLEAQDCVDGRKLRVRSRRIMTPGDGVSCLSYTVDLQKAAKAERRNQLLHSSNVIASPTVWMWRPRLGGDDEVRVTFALPDDVQISVPWRPMQSDESVYQLTASPQSGSAVAIFGRFDSSVATIAGARLRIDTLRSWQRVDADAVVDWVREAANNVTLTYGRFPNPAARVVVFPIGSSRSRSDSPVYFGRVVRDGGETVELLIDPDEPTEAFYDDWTATHELSHMMLPFVHSEQRWLSEGFAQYYQNVLLARAGRYTQLDAWQKLHDGFERGRSSVPRLSPNQAAGGGERNSRMKVYWSGAALALMADVELRRRSNGAESLDAVLGQFQRCCLPSQQSWTGEELFAAFDSFLQEPLFMNLYRLHADSAGFPDVRPLLQRLGVVVEQGEVSLDDDAELVEIRAALTARRYTDGSDR